MDEPVGHTIDGTPWEEARGPHLPDRLTRIPAKLPRASWAFVILAVATGVILALDHSLPLWPDTDADVGPYVRNVLDLILWVIPSIATILFGAALFARHRRAWTTHRVLAVGLVMLATGEALQAVTNNLDDVFRAVSPPPDEMMFLTPSEIAYRVLTSIVIALGTFYVARGLRAARVQPDRERRSRWVIAIAITAVLLAGSSIAVSTYEIIVAAADDPGNAYLPYNGTVVVVSWLILAAQAYLAVVLWAGMAAGERPAWRLGTAGIWAILIATGSAAVGSAALYAVATPDMDYTAWSWVSLTWTTVSVVGYVLLLAAFSRGLPSAPEDDRPAWAG